MRIRAIRTGAVAMKERQREGSGPGPTRDWVTADEEIGQQLRALGFEPDDVHRVVLTHLHIAPTRVEFDPVAYGPFEASRALMDAGEIVLLPTPGHTAGHLSVAVRERDRLVFSQAAPGNSPAASMRTPR